MVEAPWTGLPPASRSFQAARAIDAGSIAPWSKNPLSSIATVASLRTCGRARAGTGWRMVLARMKPISEPSAAKIAEERPRCTGFRRESGGPEL